MTGGGNGGAQTVPTEVTVASVPGATVTPVGCGPSVPIGDLPTVPPGTPIGSNTATGNMIANTTGNAATGNMIANTTGNTATGNMIANTTGNTTTGSSTTGGGGSTGGNLPVVISVAGLAKSTNGPPTAAGFIDQTANGRVPYSTWTITCPPGSVPQNGTFTASIGGAGQVTLSPLTPGSTNAVTATSSTGATAAGTATMTADGNFFYANLVNTTPGSGGARLFVFGGVPVNQSFYAPTPNQQLFAFTVQPDAALASATSPQTIPFLPSNYGGTMPVLPGNVSPVYLTASPNQQFGSYNADTNPSGGSPHFLQASLAVNGQGDGQSSALVVATGAFSTSNAGSVAAAGPVRGTVLTSATAPLVRIDSGLATVPDGNGNNLFGGKSPSGFVLDQNQYNGGNFSLRRRARRPSRCHPRLPLVTASTSRSPPRTCRPACARLLPAARSCSRQDIFEGSCEPALGLGRAMR